jgi:uncharacterized surface protein with fasciclin (FAS1) repeats
MSSGLRPGGPAVWRLVVAAWGRRFVDRFLTTTLPSVLSPGNVAALVRGAPAEFMILTEAADLPRLSDHPLMRRLSEMLTVRTVCIDQIGGDGKYDRMTRIHRLGMEGAAQADAGLILLTPDAIWADGTLASVRRAAELGYQAVLMDGPRVVGPAFLADLEAFRGPESDTINVGPRALMELSARHIHPNEAAWNWHSPVIHDAPFQLHWPVAGEGMVTRAFCMHPLFVRPRREIGDFVGAIDNGLVDRIVDDFSLIYYCRDSDEMAVVSIDELGFSSASIKRTDKRDRILRVAKWVTSVATPQNRHAALHPARRHFTEVTERRWRTAERLSAAHMDAVLACRQLLLLHATLMEHGLDTAAGLLAFALHQRGLVGWLGRARPRTFLVPAEAAASRWLNDESGSQLLQQGQKAALFCLLANHVRDGRMTADELRTLLPGVSIVEGDIPLEDGIVHVIDRVLG